MSEQKRGTFGHTDERPSIDAKITNPTRKDELLAKIRLGKKDLVHRPQIDELTEEDLRIEMEAQLERLTGPDLNRYFERLKQDVLNDLLRGEKYISARRMRMLAKALENKIEKNFTEGDKTRLGLVQKFIKEEMGE